MITREYLRQTFNYENGMLVWRGNRGSNNTRGLPAGCPGPYGYWKITLNGKAHRAHRLVWLYFNESVPAEIDHINGDRSDNRIENLRSSTRAGNTRNTKVRKDCSSGIKGVRWVPEKRKWVARLRFDGKLRHLGYFTTPEAAEAAICNTRSVVHGDFANNG